MRRVFADLHLTPDVHNIEQIKRLTLKAADMGYQYVALTLRPDSAKKEPAHLATLCKEAGLDYVSRIDLKPKNGYELTSVLRTCRRRFDVVAVFCATKAVARQAAKDRRVDILNFPVFPSDTRLFDPAEARLASRSSASLEIDMAPLLTSEESVRSRLLSALRRQAAISRVYNIPLVISSGTADEWLLRKPMEMAALASLFDVKGNAALDAVSKNPATIVKRNREKLKDSFVLPGICVIRKGKDS